MVDNDADVCQVSTITVPVSSNEETSAGLFVSDAGRTTNPRGRPRITTERPWDAQGVSRSTYYERIKPTLPVQMSTITEPFRWFCIRLTFLPDDGPTKVNQAIRNMGFETFFPCEWLPPVAAHRTAAGRAIPAKSERIVPLLRTYALVRFDRTATQWRELAVFGQIMGAPEWPTPIPDQDIVEMRKTLAPNDVQYPPKVGTTHGAKRRWVSFAAGLSQMEIA